MGGICCKFFLRGKPQNLIQLGYAKCQLWLPPCLSHFATVIHATREECSLLEIQPDELHDKMQDPEFVEEVQLIDVREPDEVYALLLLCLFYFAFLINAFQMIWSFLHDRAKASLPGFQILPLRQFGSWGPEITTKFDTQKDTYVMVCTVLYLHTKNKVPLSHFLFILELYKDVIRLKCLDVFLFFWYSLVLAPSLSCTCLGPSFSSFYSLIHPEFYIDKWLSCSVTMVCDHYKLPSGCSHRYILTFIFVLLESNI